MTMRTSIFILIFISEVTHAVPLPKCPTSNLGPSEQATMLHRVLLLGADGRMTFEEFAASKVGDHKKAEEIKRLKSEFSGLGILTCGGAISTAQLTGANDVITLASHTQFGPNCEDYRARKGRCTFKPVFIDHPPVTVDANSIQGSCPRPNRRMDWAVAKLERPIKGARYLKVPEVDTRWRRETKIIQVSGRHYKNFRRGNQNPTIQECAVRGAGSEAGDYHDCDSDGMSSGSAHVDVSPQKAEDLDSPASSHTLLAIHVGGGLGKETPEGTPDSRLKEYEYKVEEGRYNGSVPVAGEFRQAILKAIGK